MSQGFNRFKLQKKVNHKLKRSRSVVSKMFGYQKKTRRDFAWKEQGHSNPFSRDDTNKRYTHLYIPVFVIACGITLYFLLFHSFFYTNTIDITGLQRIDETELRTTINGILDYKSFKLFSQRNYFLTNLDDIRDIIKERFPIEHIIITQHFPHTLSIVIEEKLSTIIYDNEDIYSYMDLSGNIIEIAKKVSDDEWQEYSYTITTTTQETLDTSTTTENMETTVLNEQTSSTPQIQNVEKTITLTNKRHIPDTQTIFLELGSYPLVHDHRKKDVQINTTILNGEEANTIINWYKQTQFSPHIALKYFIIRDDIGTLDIQTYDGWYIRTRMSREVSSQVKKIEELFKEQISPEKINYIDTRYDNRIYWQ